MRRAHSTLAERPGSICFIRLGLSLGSASVGMVSPFRFADYVLRGKFMQGNEFAEEYRAIDRLTGRLTVLDKQLESCRYPVRQQSQHPIREKLIPQDDI